MHLDSTDLNAIALQPLKQPLIRMMSSWLLGTPPTDLEMKGVVDELHANPARAFMVREVFIRRFGFALPAPSTIQAIAGYGPILEVGAGTGYLSRLLELAGAEVLATNGGDPGAFGITAGSCYPVIADTDAAEAIAQAPEFTVLLSWPDDGPWVARALDALAPGQRIVLIGEHLGGCCAGPEVFDRLNRHFTRLDTLRHFVFPRLHDAVEVWRRVS